MASLTTTSTTPTRNDLLQDESNRSVAKAFDDCKTFLYYLDSGKNYEQALEPYCVEGASFVCQCDTLADIKTVKAYAAWWQELVAQAFHGHGMKRIVKHLSFDEQNRTVAYVATLQGGPKLKQMHTDYTFLVRLSEEGKVERVEKIWNDFYALKQAGWMEATEEKDQARYYD